MAELKTLKQIFEDRAYYANDLIASIILKDLKKEAIKWLDDHMVHSKKANLDLVAFIKHFFNITKEDLQ